MAGFGLFAAIMMAMMSLFYLEQLPGKDKMERLEAELRREHGFYLAATDPIEMKLLVAKKKGDPMGLKVTCATRMDLRKHGPRAVQGILERVGRSALEHPDWSRRIGYVKLSHAGKPEVEITVRFEEPKARSALPANLMRGKPASKSTSKPPSKPTRK